MSVRTVVKRCDLVADAIRHIGSCRHATVRTHNDAAIVSYSHDRCSRRGLLACPRGWQCTRELPRIFGGDYHLPGNSLHNARCLVEGP